MEKKVFLNSKGFISISKVLSREVCAKIQKELETDGFSTYLYNYLLNMGIHYDEFEDIDDFFQELANLLEDTIFVSDDYTIFTFELIKKAFIERIEDLEYYDEYDCDLSFSDFLRDYDIYESEF